MPQRTNDLKPGFRIGAYVLQVDDDQGSLCCEPQWDSEACFVVFDCSHIERCEIGEKKSWFVVLNNLTIRNIRSTFEKYFKRKNAQVVDLFASEGHGE